MLNGIGRDYLLSNVITRPACLSAVTIISPRALLAVTDSAEGVAVSLAGRRCSCAWLVSASQVSGGSWATF